MPVQYSTSETQWEWAPLTNFCPLAHWPSPEQILSTTSQGPTVSAMAHPYPQLLLLSSWRKWTVPPDSPSSCCRDTWPVCPEVYPALKHLGGDKAWCPFVPCRSKQCPGLWRREAKLQILDPGVGVSLPTSYRALNSQMFGIFSSSNI